MPELPNRHRTARRIGWIVAGITVLVIGGWWMWGSGETPRAPVVNKVVVLKPAPSKFLPTPVHDPRMSRFPYAPGWPVRLPGEVAATPVVADLLGDGKLEVVASCRAAANPAKGIVEGEPLLFAFKADGTLLAGWPLELQASVPGKAKPGIYQWTSSPSVFRRDGKDNLVIVGGHAGIVVVHGDGTVRRLGGGSDWHDNIPLVDLDGRGIPDIAVGKFIANVDGGPVQGWPASRQFSNGYAPCIGDAMGDGKLRIYHLFYNRFIGCFDTQGRPLAGWPQNSQQPAWFAPVMGDVLGNGQMQIFHSWGKHVFAWTADGKPLLPSKAPWEMPGLFKSGDFFFPSSPSLADIDGDGKAEVVLFDRVSQTIRAWHGDGKGITPNPPGIRIGDELRVTVQNIPGPQLAVSQRVNEKGAIILAGLDEVPAWGFNEETLAQAIQQDYRDEGIAGKAVVSVSITHTSASNRPTTMSNVEALRQFVEGFAGGNSFDGLVAALPTGNARGVSVVSLGDDPKMMDFFAGSFWVRRFPDGRVQIMNMLPEDSQMDWVQPTVADVEGTGLADVVFGLSDGRLLVYRTGLAYQAERMQWPTANGNFQHTGAWHKIPLIPLTASLDLRVPAESDADGCVRQRHCRHF